MTMFATLFALGVIDAAATAYGHALGVFSEANPLLAPLFAAHPLLGFAATALGATASVWLLRYLWRRYPRYLPVVVAVYATLGVRVYIAAMHAYWLGDSVWVWWTCAGKWAK